MKLSIGIVGLPNVGKSTLFKALTKQEVKIANYPFVTIDPNVGVVPMPDERLEKIAKVRGSKEILPAVLEFLDIAGLVKGAHQGAGLGNQFLAHIREVDAIIHLVRVFKDKEIIHFEVYSTSSGQAEPDPVRDFETILEELRQKDLSSKEQVNLLSKKPQVVVLNGEPADVSEELKDKIRKKGFPHLIFDLKNDLSKEDFQNLFQAITNLLDLITFYTANENEARSWFVKKGTKAPQAAGVVHTDFEKKFIRAEVINWQKLLEASQSSPSTSSGQQPNAWAVAKQKGWLRTEGKEYIVQDGDVIEIRHG
jgi:small GTP-binding protein